MRPTLLQQLGYTHEKRALILHHDDLGMNTGANVAFIELLKRGVITSGSVMVPCPQFDEFVELIRNNTSADVGVHLTLTSEWSEYRWSPISTSSASSGLIDDAGYFWKSRALVRKHAQPKAALIELRAQIEKALKAGIDATHLDCHMGIGLTPELVDVYIQLGQEYRLPIILPRNIESALKIFSMDNITSAYYDPIIDRLDAVGFPLVDYFFITPGYSAEEINSGYRDSIRKINDGITFFSIHPSSPGDIKHIDPDKYQWRLDEYNFFANDFNPQYLDENNIASITFREIRDLMRK